MDEVPRKPKLPYATRPYATPPPPGCRTVPFSPKVRGVLALTLMLSDFCAACRGLLYWGKITATPPQREVGGTLCTDAPHLGRSVYCCSHVLMPSLQFWCLCMTDTEAVRLLFAPLARFTLATAKFSFSKVALLPNTP